jgi:hypothetical protein
MGAPYVRAQSDCRNFPNFAKSAAESQTERLDNRRDPDKMNMELRLSLIKKACPDFGVMPESPACEFSPRLTELL